MPRSMADVRAECASLGITPGRSIAECEARIFAYHEGKKDTGNAGDDAPEHDKAPCGNDCDEIATGRSTTTVANTTPTSGGVTVFSQANKAYVPKRRDTKANYNRLQRKQMRKATRKAQRRAAK